METIFGQKYPDLLIYICIPLIISILTIALPFLIQAINRLDEKYNSTIIINAFYKSYIVRLFIGILALSIISIFLWAFQITCPEDFHPIFENSSGPLLLSLSTVLIIFLSLFVWLISQYNKASSLFKHLRKKHRNSFITQKSREMYFGSICELFYYAIRTSNEKLSREILDYFATLFIKERSTKTNKEIEYPNSYYELIYESNEYINTREKRSISLFNGSTMLSFLIEDYQKTFISNTTFRYIWMSMRQAIFHNNDDMIISYWQKAHQHIAYILKPLSRQYNAEFTAVINEEEVRNRDQRIIRFKEFHYALGALVLYSSKYDVLNEIMYYSNMKTPLPVYYLVPNSFRTLIDDYIKFEDQLMNPVYYEGNYSFPNISGVDANNIILGWIQRYFAILFIRQYGIPKQYHEALYQIDLPDLPNTLADLTNWKEKIYSLKYWVSHYIHKEEITIKTLKLDGLYDDSVLIQRKQEHPIKVLNDYIKLIEEKYAKVKEEQPIAISKRKEFDNYAIEIITRNLMSIQRATSNINVEDENLEMSSFIAQPRHDILEKGAFAEDQDIGYINSLEITAGAICMEMEHYFTIAFAVVKNKIRYTVVFEDLFNAIDKLKIDNTFIIISIGLSMSHRMIYNRPVGLEEADGIYKYKGVEIVEFGYSQLDDLNRAFYVMKKTDLPFLNIHPLQDKTIDMFKYDLINNDYKIYTNVLDLNKEENRTIREGIEKTYTNKEELSEKVLACVGVSYEIRWPKGAKCIQIKEYDSFTHRGSPTSLSAINPFE